jgi:putative flippase GtrA
MGRLPPLLSLFAATLMIMAVAFADGRPTVFYDSHAYDVMGQNLIQVIEEYPASIHFKMKPGVKFGDRPVDTDRMIDPATMGARSSLYGVFLHGAYLIGTLWLLAAVQSFLAAWVIYLLWRTMAPRAPSWSYLVVTAGCVIGTSLSFFTTFAMPDIFAGIGGGAMVLILSQADRLKKRELVGLWLLAAYSMTIHKSHLGTGLVMAVCGGLLMWIMGLRLPSVARRTALLLSAFVLAWGAGALVDSAYTARTGYKLGHPPFMMARAMADGPGAVYLFYACEKAQKAGAPPPFAACQFKQNVGRSTDNILWSDRKKLGVFNIADRPTRLRLEAEEMRFVVGTVLFDPLGQAWASLHNWFDQAVAYQVDDPLRNPSAYLRGRYWPTTFLPRLIPNFEACRPPKDCRPPFNFYLLANWHGTVLAASLILLIWRLSLKDVRQAVLARGLRTDQDAARTVSVVLLLVGVCLVNAAICGVLSGPFARYQSRLIWLLPAGAGLTLCALPIGWRALADQALRVWGWGMVIWERLRLIPVVGRFLPPLNGHFMRFCVVGGLGFIVDFSVLKAVVYLGVSPLAGRMISFPAALTATWLTNRAWTFREHRGSQSLLKEISTYAAVQSVGFIANYAVYTAMILWLPILRGALLPPMVAGTAAGLVINYLGSKHIVFRRRAKAP